MNVCHLNCMCMFLCIFTRVYIQSPTLKIMCSKMVRGGLFQRKQLVVHPSALLFFIHVDEKTNFCTCVRHPVYAQFDSGLLVIPSFSLEVISYIRSGFCSFFLGGGFYFIFYIYFTSIIIFILLCFFSIKMIRVYNLN